ncbi:alpha/beta hydrolase [Polluticaenibacter yanchengensis]|uniref:Alpha/beta hydrolase n=1 Tax=Polluticaenibacter yanchengensis TaxID=3014562 RepID=A0ABT4UE99_9BACT|nr:alpha/beta hydrolase [Chitinophagaceae bacterium LY-5]
MKLISFLVLLAISNLAFAQDFLPLWPKGKMPNSKGLPIKDSIANERIYQVGTPGMYVYLPSIQENNGAAVVICPGGGYSRLAYMISGIQLAKWFNTLGISAFVLNYRLPHSPDLVAREYGPLMDAQRAMKLIRANAVKWQIDTARVGILGSSAGGHLAALASNYSKDLTAIKDSIDNRSYLPDFTILISPVIDLGVYAHKGSRTNLLGDQPSDSLVKQFSVQNLVTGKTPVTFIVGAMDDKVVVPMNSLLYYQALLLHNVSGSYHVFPQGAHAIALRNNPGSTNLWTNLCEEWMKEMKIIRPLK